LGGGARSSEWLQIKADATGRTIVACENEESTVAGCAYMAGLHAGYLKSITDAQSITARGKVYLPEENADFYKRKYLLYKECYERLKDLHR